MKPVTRNLIANYIGKGWAMVINLIATPLLIKLLGIESYGLIGFYTTLYGVINLLDFGISPTINRELAQYSVDEKQKSRGRDLVRTLEIGYWLIGIILGITVYFGAPIIAEKWLQTSELGTETLIHSIRLMGFLVVLEWPITFYQGCLLGLQKHVILNTINIVNSLFKFGGALAILTYVSPTIDAFFTWQLVISTLLIIFLVISVWQNLPHKEGKPIFDLQLLEKIWKFALSLNLISFIGLITHQMDKLFVSHWFTLDVFGFYSLATTVSTGFTTLVSPIYMTFFPQLSTLVAQKNDLKLRKVYHEACQLVSVAILPAVTTGVIFAYEIINLWTGDSVVAANTAPIAAILLIGTACNALTTMPYQAQVSHGWTRLALYSNIISLPLVIILIFLFNQWFGIIGVANIWIIRNALMLVITTPLMHRQILRGEFKTWLLQDTLIPLSICLALGSIIIIFEYAGFQLRNSIYVMLIFATIIQIVSVLSVPYTRSKFFEYLLKIKVRIQHAF